MDTNQANSCYSPWHCAGNAHHWNPQACQYRTQYRGI